MPEGSRPPLDGIVVADLTKALSGPYATMMLADLGARVVKVEPPRGDESRSWGPPFVGPTDAPLSTYFLACNRSKESVVADLTTDDGRDLLTRLVRRSDVLVENGRPGALGRLGFDEDHLRELNPRLVVLSISGFGPDGPQAQRPGYDQIAQGEGGLMSITGPPGEPTRFGVPVTDLLAGIFGVVGILAALRERDSTGRGQVVHTSLLAAAVAVHAYQGTRWTVAGEIPTSPGNFHPSIAPYGPFRTGDGILQIAAGTAGHWRALAEVLGLDADDPRFGTNSDRVAHHDELVATLETALATADAGTWEARLEAVGVPAGRIRTIDQVYGCAQTLSQGLLLSAPDPTLGTVNLPGSPLRFDRAVGPPRPAASAPGLGEHTDSVRAWLGMGP